MLHFSFLLMLLVCIVLLQVSNMDKALELSWIPPAVDFPILAKSIIHSPFSYRFSNSNTYSSMSNVIAIRRTYPFADDPHYDWELYLKRVVPLSAIWLVPIFCFLGQVPVHAQKETEHNHNNSQSSLVSGII